MEINKILKPIGDACFISCMILGASAESPLRAILGFVGFVALGIGYNFSQQY